MTTTTHRKAPSTVSLSLKSNSNWYIRLLWSAKRGFTEKADRMGLVCSQADIKFKNVAKCVKDILFKGKSFEL